jgi:hypothetical protein
LDGSSLIIAAYPTDASPKPLLKSRTNRSKPWCWPVRMAVSTGWLVVCPTFAGRVTGSIGQTSPGATAGLADTLSDPAVGRLAGDTAERLVAGGVAAEASDAPPVVVISAP